MSSRTVQRFQVAHPGRRALRRIRRLEKAMQARERDVRALERQVARLDVHAAGDPRRADQ